MHPADDRLADLFEVIIGTGEGLRRGEALALRWSDLDSRVLFIHPTEAPCPESPGD